jgi:hypothetical protein
MTDITIEEATSRLSADIQRLGGEGYIQNNRCMVLPGRRPVVWEWPEGTEFAHSEFGPACEAMKKVAVALHSIDKIKSDERLTDQAKAADTQKALDLAEFELQLIQNGIDLLESNFSTVEREFFQHPTKPVDMGGLMDDREVRDWLRSLTHPQRLSALKDAQAPMLAAVLRSPIPWEESVQHVAELRWRELRETTEPDKVRDITRRRERFNSLARVMKDTRGTHRRDATAAGQGTRSQVIVHVAGLAVRWAC